MHYNDVPQGIKTLQMIAGIAPPALTWWLTGSWVEALIVFGIGVIGGLVALKAAMVILFPASRRLPDGGFDQGYIDMQTRKAIPVHLWAGPIIGALAAAFFVLF
jgi:hypothetical protein